MFSPDGPVAGSTAVRNPRRRQRAPSDDSIALRRTTKRRKRSLLAPDTFEPPLAPKVNGHAGQANGNITANGHATESRKQREVSLDISSLSIRNKGSKKEDKEKRVNKAQEAVIQVFRSNRNLVYHAITLYHRLRTTTMWSHMRPIFQISCGTS